MQRRSTRLLAYAAWVLLLGVSALLLWLKPVDARPGILCEKGHFSAEGPSILANGDFDAVPNLAWFSRGIEDHSEFFVAPVPDGRHDSLGVLVDGMAIHQRCLWNGQPGYLMITAWARCMDTPANGPATACLHIGCYNEEMYYDEKGREIYGVLGEAGVRRVLRDTMWREMTMTVRVPQHTREVWITIDSSNDEMLYFDDVSATLAAPVATE